MQKNYMNFNNFELNCKWIIQSIQFSLPQIRLSVLIFKLNLCKIRTVDVELE